MFSHLKHYIALEMVPVSSLLLTCSNLYHPIHHIFRSSLIAVNTKSLNVHSSVQKELPFCDIYMLYITMVMCANVYINNWQIFFPASGSHICHMEEADYYFCLEVLRECIKKTNTKSNPLWHNKHHVCHKECYRSSSSWSLWDYIGKACSYKLIHGLHTVI
jgi:hypothetical protein